MADVQLEKGFTRLANRLDEAMAYAEFSLTQHKVVRVIARLTFGWGKLTVRISHSALAKRCNLSFTGGFRRALYELLREGVIVEVEAASGSSSPAVYRLNKDFERWGRFSVPEAALKALAREGPTHADYLMSEGPTHADYLVSETKTADAPSDDQPIVPPAGRPSGGMSSSPAGGMSSCPDLGIGSEDNLPTANELPDRKDTSKDRTAVITSTAREGLNSIKLVVAANRGLAEHPKRPQPIPRILPGQGSTVEAVEQLEAADVPQAFAEGAIYELAKAHRSTTEVRGLLYFVAATVRQWEEAKVAEAVKSSPAPAAIARAGERKGPTWDQRNASRDVERAREERRATLDRRYAVERKEAIARWKATNAEQYAVVEAEVKADTGLFVTGGPSGQAMLDRMIEIALVDRFQCFPSADEWLEQQRVSA